MSPNREILRAYMASPSNIPALLVDDAEWVEWAVGVPALGVRTRGRAAYIGNLGDPDLHTRITRLTEENIRVVAEGAVRVPQKEGGVLMVRFYDISELENGRVKRLSSYAVRRKDSS